MEIARLRVWAKVVAITDVIVCLVVLCINIVGLLWVIFLLGASINDTSNQQILEEFDSAKHMEYKKYEHIWTLAAKLSVGAFMSGIQLWAAVLLLHAAKLGRHPREALKNAGTWIWTTSMVLVIGILGGIGYLATLQFLIILTWRAGSLFVVNNFRKETKGFIQFSIPQP